MEFDDPHSTFVDDSAQRGGDATDSSPWELIAERIDQLAAAWEQTLDNDLPLPDLAAFVAGLDEATAYTVLVELAKFDMERRWQTDREPRKAEWYARHIPPLGPIEHLPIDLIYEELQARMQRGESITAEELRDRFPHQADRLNELLGGMAVSGSPTCTYYADTVHSDVKPRGHVERGEFSRFRAGERIDDFELLAPLGSGAFAKVFLARQLSMERLVALKISKQVGSEPQTLAQLDHPNIVRVFDLRHTDEPPVRLLYMEVVSGGTLLDAQSALRRSPVYSEATTGDDCATRTNGALVAQSAIPPAPGALYLAAIDERLRAVGAEVPTGSATRRWLTTASWPEVVCWLGAKLAEGLHYAHQRGVLHRDIKPANVLLTSEGAPKLADFNVSFNGGRADENPEDAFGGSLAYMSPEQLEACHPLLAGSPQLVRETSDVYALGVLLWEMLAGRRPFDDEKVGTGGGTLVRLQRMIDARRGGDLESLANQLPDDCPDALRQVLVKTLQPDKPQRFASAGELARSLDMCLHPRCWQLMQAPKSRLGRWTVNRSVFAMVLAGLIPNIAFAAFNFVYNLNRIWNHQDRALTERFWIVQGWINGIAFPLGIAIGAKVAFDTLKMLKPDQATQSQRGTRRVLHFGAFVSILLLSIWFVSGLAFPIALFAGRPDRQTIGFFIHFFTSLALCGFGATAYPYFLITFLAVRYLTPQLIRNGVIKGPRRADLQSVVRMNRLHLALSATVPLLGMLLFSVFGEGLVFGEDQKLRMTWPPIVVGAAGLVGFCAMFVLERKIDADLHALDYIAE